MHRTRRLAAATCAGAFLVVTFAHGLAVDDSDTPWHVADGKLILSRLRQGVLGPPRTDPFSWTARGRPWHPNAWAFDLLADLAYKAGRWTGISVLRLVLLAGIIAAGWWLSGRLSTSLWPRALALLLTTTFVAPFAVFRPQLASFILLPVTLVLAGRFLDGRRPALSLALLAVLVSLWSDLHGVVVAGVVAIAAAASGYVLERRSWRAVRRAGAVAVVALAASAASPYGWSVWTYATKTRNASRNIVEWQHPSWHSSGDVTVFGVIGIVCLWALLVRRPVPFQDLLPAAAMAVLGLDAVRNEPLAALAALPLLVAMMERLADIMRARTPPWLRDAQTRRPGALSPPIGYSAMVIVALAVELFVDHGASGLNLARLRPGAFPIASAAALPSGCRLLNEYADGGYLILARPDIPVSEDGRNDLYGAAFVDSQNALLSGANGVAGLDSLGVTCVLVAPRQGLVHELAASAEWTRIAADSHAQAWIRTSGAPATSHR